MALLTLDIDGTVLAVVMALALIYLGTLTAPQGGYLGAFYLFVMLYFLTLSAIVTHLGERLKKSQKLYQETRGYRNVLANGLGPLIFAFLAYYLFTSYQAAFGQFSFIYLVGFLSSVAAVTADKFSSEVGVLGKKPISIITFRKIEKGKSGGITVLGTSAGALGAFLIALIAGYGALTLFPSHSASLWPAAASIIAITAGGFVGTVVDSIFGHWEEKGIGNKYTTNFICSIAGGAFGIAAYLALASI